ncbi:MAG: TetR family transcriptional regulator [Acidaminococcaceae bacterium]|nr:TetR family transcriptional regulator [Acidaminococcaceae bacterium]
MGFIRARGEEQKKIRIQQIVDAAASLYAEIGYDKVTFSQIGRKLSFSRLNLYNYYHCKEDIFLTLLLQDIWKTVEDARNTFSGAVTDRDAFCLAWAELMLRHQRMMALFSIANTVILKDASSEMHRRFRLEMSQTSDELVALVQELFPKFTREQAWLFVECESSYALTLYPASVEYKNRMHIEVFPDVGRGTRDFISQYVTFLKVLLKGLEK